ncbi:hypothetical protein [uncultured Mailhella sp.]|uniref:hypothetical protein n=1 Tax=uncultured Mailhella sp. TaxID=1981031 RepID=UPI0025D803C0|nr:hypothetical protein [uncultured Mailhella sp.]
MRSRHFALVVCLLCLCLPALSGCMQVKSAYKETKTFYHTHINRPSTLNTEERTVLEKSQRDLVQSVMPIDEELTRLEKALDAMATPPDAEAAASFLRRFPWLSGLSMVAPDGTLGASIPGTPLKQLDYAPLLELAPKALPRDLRASIQDTPLGPEILIARPFLQEDRLQVLLVATFDFRALLPFASSPGDFIVRSGDVLIWSGDMDYASTPLASINWTEYLKEHSDGILSNENGSMMWISRYIGGKPIVFAAPVK